MKLCSMAFPRNDEHLGVGTGSLSRWLVVRIATSVGNNDHLGRDGFLTLEMLVGEEIWIIEQQ